LLDGLVRAGLVVAVAILTAITGPTSGVLTAVWALTLFLVLFVYDVFFEVVAGGRTPGKRWSGLRVVTLSGGAITVGASVVRNLLRIIDEIPGIYLVGIVLVFLTKRNQRLGDIVAGTLVVRDRRAIERNAAWSREVVGEGDHTGAW